MVMPVCLFFCVFLFSSLRLFEELFLREREGEDQDGSMSVFCPFLFVLLGLVGFEQLDRVKRPLTSIRCKAPGNEQKIEQ